MRRLAVLVVLVAASSRAGAEEPWAGSLRLAGGSDSNVFRDPGARQQALVLRLWADVAGEPVDALRLSASGAFEQSAYDGRLNERTGDVRAWYRHALGGGVALSLSSLTAYQRDLSVFADGQVSMIGATLRTERAQHLLTALELERGDFDLEGSVRGDVRSTSGSEQYLLLGVEVGGAVRWVPRPDVALRLRYAYLHRTIDGLSARNPAGGLAGVSRELVLGIHALRGQVRWSPAEGIWLHARYDRSTITDDFTGFYDSVEQDARVGASLLLSRIVQVDLLVDHLDRRYGDRVGSTDSPSADAFLEVSAEVDLWVFEHLGLTGRYQLERASADPTGMLYTRHVVLLGAAARLGASD